MGAFYALMKNWKSRLEPPVRFDPPRSSYASLEDRIALNTIRSRSRDDNDGKLMAQRDRHWLLGYIDRHGL